MTVEDRLGYPMASLSLSEARRALAPDSGPALVEGIGRRRYHALRLIPGATMQALYSQLRGRCRVPVAEDNQTVAIQRLGCGVAFRHTHTAAWESPRWGQA